MRIPPPPESPALRAALLAAPAAALWLAAPVWAGQAPEDKAMPWIEMIFGLLGGLAIFLFGMEQMGDGLKAAAGERMRHILATLTRNRVSAAVTGAVVTAIIQSSSVTTVLVVGFVSAGVMTFGQSIGVIMGANVGTTVTAQIVAFNVEEAALAMIAIGFGMLFLARADRVKHYGAILMGLGLVFFGMGIMSDAMHPLRSYPPFLDLMAEMENPLVGILIAMTFTALVQSSSATTGIVIVMASQGFVTLEAGIALAFGANIGTCVTAMLASLGKPREAVRAAVVHVLFNVLGVLLWIGFIDQLAALVAAISPAHPGLAGSERLAAEAPRQIANANTVFNVINTVIFLGFTAPLARLVTRLVPDRPMREKVLVRPRFLDEELVATPSLALERVRLEIGHLGEIVQAMFAKVPEALGSSRLEPIEAIAMMDDQVDVLENHIIRYLGRVRKRSLSDEESHSFLALMRATDNLESIGDVIETDIVALGKQRIAENLEVSDTMRELLGGLHATVAKALDAAIRAVRDDDQRAAQETVAWKDEIDRRIDEVLAHQARKLVEDDPRRLAVFRMEMEAIDKLKRIHTLAKRIARGVLPGGLSDEEG